MLVPIVAGTEPVEAAVPIDVLRRAGADVTVASADDGELVVEVMYGVRIVADALVAGGDCAAAHFDLIVLPVRTIYCGQWRHRWMRHGRSSS